MSSESISIRSFTWVFLTLAVIMSIVAVLYVIYAYFVNPEWNTWSTIITISLFSIMIIATALFIISLFFGEIKSIGKSGLARWNDEDCSRIQAQIKKHEDKVEELKEQGKNCAGKKNSRLINDEEVRKAEAWDKFLIANANRNMLYTAAKDADPIAAEKIRVNVLRAADTRAAARAENEAEFQRLGRLPLPQL